MRIYLLLLPLLCYLVACTPEDPTLPGNLVPGTVTQDTRLTGVPVNGTSLYVETYGDENAPPIFVLEGGPGDDFTYLLDLNLDIEGTSLTDEYG